MLATAPAGPAMFVVPVSIIAVEAPAMSIDFPCTVSARFLSMLVKCNIIVAFHLLFILISQYWGVPIRL
jgi:hypothetical protein